ncbi:MAG: ABC transporter permease subunit [Eubacteriales bacterium]|nr:ABC transporter permease subunit [Eubacteriales bacterium]MDD3350630.1 ABC transporter permease subunit [Eubacteriales bacterium]
MDSITKNKGSMQKRITTLLVLAFWLGIWQLGAVWIGHDLLLVSPFAVLATLVSQITEGVFWSTVAYSFLRIVSGFLLAIVVGVFLAVLSAANAIVKALLAPFFGVIKSIPVASFIILILIWAGSGSLSLIISFLMVLPIIYMNVLEGILQTDRKLLEMAKVFHVPFHKKLAAIFVPGVLPYFSSACKIGLGLCWKSGIAAEVIGLPTGSIGERLYQAKIFLSTADLFAWTIVIVAISYAFEKAFLFALRRFALRLEKGDTRWI